jgi:lysozyme
MTLPASLSDVIIDISHWQAPVDFTQVKSAGVLAVILKTTQGTGFFDPTYAARVPAARAAGLLVAGYHFFDASDAAAQAAYYLAHAGDVAVHVLDFEPLATNPALEAGAAVWCQAVQKATGRWPLLYAGRWEIQVANPILLQCPLWLPEWGSDPVPPPGFATWTFWQYTATATVPGISGAVSRTKYAGSADQLAAWWAGASDPTTRDAKLKALIAKMETKIKEQADLALQIDVLVNAPVPLSPTPGSAS